VDVLEIVRQSIVHNAGFGPRPCILLGLGNTGLEMPLAQRVPHITYAAVAAWGSDPNLNECIRPPSAAGPSAPVPDSPGGSARGLAVGGPAGSATAAAPDPSSKRASADSVPASPRSPRAEGGAGAPEAATVPTTFTLPVEDALAAAASTQIDVIAKFHTCRNAVNARMKAASTKQADALEGVDQKVYLKDYPGIKTRAADPKPAHNVFSFDQEYRTLLDKVCPIHSNIPCPTAPCPDKPVGGGCKAVEPNRWDALVGDPRAAGTEPAPARWQNANYAIAGLMRHAPVVFFDITLLNATIPFVLALRWLRTAMAGALPLSQPEIDPPPLLDAKALQGVTQLRGRLKPPSTVESPLKDAPARKALVNGEAGDTATDWELLTVASYEAVWSKTTWCFCDDPSGCPDPQMQAAQRAAAQLRAAAGSAPAAGSRPGRVLSSVLQAGTVLRRMHPSTRGSRVAPAPARQLFKCPDKWRGKAPWAFMADLLNPTGNPKGTKELRAFEEACGPVAATVQWWEQNGELGDFDQSAAADPAPAPEPVANDAGADKRANLAKRGIADARNRRNRRLRRNAHRVRAARNVAHAIYLADQDAAMQALNELDTRYPAASAVVAGAGAGAGAAAGSGVSAGASGTGASAAGAPGASGTGAAGAGVSAGTASGAAVPAILPAPAGAGPVTRL